MSTDCTVELCGLVVQFESLILNLKFWLNFLT